MKPVIACSLMIIVLAGMSCTPSREPMPMACEVLERINIATRLGAGATLQSNISKRDEKVHLSNCNIELNDGSKGPGPSLLLREFFHDGLPAAIKARADYAAGLQRQLNLDQAEIEEVAIGEAALWIGGGLQQLTVWTRGGSVMMIVTGGPEGRALAEEIASSIVSAYP